VRRAGGERHLRDGDPLPLCCLGGRSGVGGGRDERWHGVRH
jgi:hypothetical protein